MEAKKDLETRVFEVKLKGNKLELPPELEDKYKLLYLYNVLHKTKYGEYFCIFAASDEFIETLVYNDSKKNLKELLEKNRGLYLPKEAQVKNGTICLPENLMKKAQIKNNSKCVLIIKNYGLQIHESNYYYAAH